MAFPLAAVFLALVPFAVLEALLVVFGVGALDRSEDPFVGFGRIQPLFELDEDEEVYRTARSRQLYFGPQEFSPGKPERTFRIFGLGGSTMRGRPYETDTSFLKWLELELNGRDSTRQYETVNCGGLSYASYRLRYILDEVLQYEPDLIVIATGHNEFLEDRTYGSLKNRSAWVGWAAEKGHSLRTVTVARQLFRGSGLQSDLESQSTDGGSSLDGEVEARLDDESGYASYHRDEQWRREVIEHFELSLRRLVETCREAQVPLILVNLGENLRDCPPFKSEHKAGLSADSLQRWQELFDKATKSEDVNLEDAIRIYQEAESIDDQYALLIYRMASCFDRLGRSDEARRYYSLAKNLDICPLRMLDETHQRLELVARETKTPLVDARRSALEHGPDQIPGNDCFMDHVHPNIGSHQRIGQLLAAKTEELQLVRANRKWGDDQRRSAYRRYFRQLGPVYLANGRRRVAWLEDWARRERLDTEAAPRDARGHLHLAQKRLDYGECDSAWEQFLLAIDTDPGLLDEVFAHAFRLFRQGRGDLAEELLIRLHHDPHGAALGAEIKLAYLILALDSGKTREAATVYSRYRDTIEQVAESQPADAGSTIKSWLDTMPDVLDRMKARLSSNPIDPTADPFDPSTVAGEPGAGSGASQIGSHAPRPEAGDVAPVTEAEDVEENAASKRAAVKQLFDKAISRSPNNAILYLGRARMHFSGEDYEAALDDATKSIQLSADNHEAYEFRATVYRRLGREAEAEADLAQAKKLAGRE